MRRLFLSTAIFLGLAIPAFAGSGPSFNLNATNVRGSTTAISESGAYEGSTGTGIAGNITAGNATSTSSAHLGANGFTGTSNASSVTTSFGSSVGWAAQGSASQAYGSGKSGGNSFNLKVGNGFRY